MKRKLKILLTFLKAYKKERITFSWNYGYGWSNEPDWKYPNTSIPNIPKNIEELAAEVAGEYWEEVWNESPGSDTEYYEIILTTFPLRESARINVRYEMYTDHTDSYSIDVVDEEVLKFLNKNNVKEIHAHYNGGGDSGEIENVEIDGKYIPDYWGTTDKTHKAIWDYLYEKLDAAFGGWEIDDGSSGDIKIFKPYDENYVLDINQSWNMRELFPSEYYKDISINDIEE